MDIVIQDQVSSVTTNTKIFSFFFYSRIQGLGLTLAFLDQQSVLHLYSTQFRYISNNADDSINLFLPLFWREGNSLIMMLLLWFWSFYIMLLWLQLLYYLLTCLSGFSLAKKGTSLSVATFFSFNLTRLNKIIYASSPCHNIQLLQLICRI